MQTSTGLGITAPRSDRRQVLVLLIGFGLGSLAWNVCWPFLPLRVQAVGIADLGEVARISGLLAGAANLITALLGPAWILLGERFGYRRQVLRAHLGTGLTMCGLGLARTPAQLAGAAAGLGMLGGNYPHYLALVATRAPAAEVGRAVGDIQAAGQIGGTIGPLVGGLVASGLGLGASFLLSGAISLTALSIAFVGIRPDDPRPPGQTRARGSLRQALAEPAQRRLMLLFVLGDAGIQGIRPLIPVVIAARLSDPATVASTTGLTATLSTAGTVVAALIVGRLSQRVAPSSILAATLPSAAVVAALIPFAHVLSALFILWALLGLAAGATAPAMFAWLSRLAPSGSGAYALLATVNMLSFAIGPALMGQASVYGLDWPFRLAGAAALLAGVFIAADRLRPARVASGE